MTYLFKLRPTNANSATYGRAQPFGQPVMRMEIGSSAMPTSSITPSSSSTRCGMARSASVMAKPQVGRAGQASVLRRSPLICSTWMMPYSTNNASIFALSSLRMLASNTFCCAVKRTGRSNVFTMWRRPLRRRCGPTSAMRPESTGRPRHQCRLSWRSHPK